MSETTTRAGWLLLALTLLNVLNLADRYLIMAFSTTIIPELGMSHLQFGLLTGVVFTAVYTVFGLVAGSLADRLDRTYVIGLGLLLWSALTAATGFAKSFVQMAAARMCIGVGEACLTPAAISMLADSFPASRRALVSGVYYMGLPIGVGGSFLFAAAVGPTLGWRGAFMLLGALGVVAAVLVVVFMADPPRGGSDKLHRQKHAAGERITAERRVELRQWVKSSLAKVEQPKMTVAQTLAASFGALKHELRSNPVFVLTLIGGTAFMFVQGGGILDLVWWVSERGYDNVQAQKLTGLVLLVGGVLGALVGGVGADWAYRRFPAGRLKFLAWTCAAALPLAVAYRLTPGHTPLFYTLAVGGAMLSLFMFGPLFSTIQEQVPVQHRSAAVALFLMCAALFGAGGGNATVGYLADVFKTAQVEQPITLAGLCMILPLLLAAPAFWLAARLQARQAPAEATLPASA